MGCLVWSSKKRVRLQRIWRNALVGSCCIAFVVLTTSQEQRLLWTPECERCICTAGLEDALMCRISKRPIGYNCFLSSCKWYFFRDVVHLTWNVFFDKRYSLTWANHKQANQSKAYINGIYKSFGAKYSYGYCSNYIQSLVISVVISNFSYEHHEYYFEVKCFVNISNVFYNQ